MEAENKPHWNRKDSPTANYNDLFPPVGHLKNGGGFVRESLPKSTKPSGLGIIRICPENYLSEGVFVQLVWRQSSESQGNTLPMPTLPRGNKTWWFDSTLIRPDFQGARVAFGVPLNSHECPSLGLETLGGSDSIFRQAMEKGMSLGKTYHFEITPPIAVTVAGCQVHSGWIVYSLIYEEKPFSTCTISIGFPMFQQGHQDFIDMGFSAVSFFCWRVKCHLSHFFYFMKSHMAEVNKPRKKWYSYHLGCPPFQFACQHQDLYIAGHPNENLHVPLGISRYPSK